MKHLMKFNEDDYYPPTYRDKTPRELEDEIDPFIEKWIDEQVGLEIGFYSVRRGGTEIIAGVDKRIIEKEKGHSRIEHSEEEMKMREESAKEEWRESAPELIEILEREGYGIYTLGSVTQWSLSLWRDDEASGGPLVRRVKERGFR